MNSDRKTATTKQELPLLLAAKHIQSIGLSRTMTYEILNRHDIPIIILGGRKFVERDKFFQWLENQTAQEVK